MPLPVIEGVVRVACRGTCPSGQPWVNVHHFRYQAAPPTDWTAAISALDPIIDKFYAGPAYSGGSPPLGQCRSTVAMIDATYTPLDGSALSMVLPHAHNGTNASSLSAASEVSMVLTLRTNKRGRRYRGRIYLPPIVGDSFGGSGEVTAAFAASMVAQYTGMMAAASGASWKPVVASYGQYKKADGTVVTWAPFATDVTTPTMDLKADVQRRRK